MEQSPQYPVVEIFDSLQGEGYNTGLPCSFLRFGRCNLACPWCDTDYREFGLMGADKIVHRVDALGLKALIVTGGEPLVQDGLDALLRRFKALGYWIAVETNGLVEAHGEWRRHVDYVSVSPKARYADSYDDARMVRRADEVRVVVDGDVEAFCRQMRDRIEAAHYFLSPCERGGALNVEETVRLLGRLNRARSTGKWLLSLQTHKLAGLR